MPELNKNNTRVVQLLEMSKEQLVELYLGELNQRKKYQNEAEWLDQLADLMRDQPDDTSKRESDLYKEYQEQVKQNKESNKKYFIQDES